MPVAELLDLAKTGGYEAFEARCLELLAAGHVSLAQLVAPFEQLEQSGQAERLATLTQMIFENVDPFSDPAAALALARIALTGSPKNDALRKSTIELYRRLYGALPGFQVIFDASGLAGGRPVRNALKLLDLCLALQPGDTLINRTEDRVVEVAEIDRVNGLFTLRREGRTVTVPSAEVARDYERIAPDDFRVLRQLRPAQLANLLESDPLAVVIGLLRSHGGHTDVDQLRHELVPKFIPAKDWSAWWTRARTAAKRSPHVLIEGRAPVILTYCAAGRTPEDETWDTLTAQKEPLDWMRTVESYLRDKRAHGEQPDHTLLERIHAHILAYIDSVRARRPAEALTCALIIDRLAAKGLPTRADPSALALAMLREAAQPALLLRDVEDEGLRERGVDLLRAARPDDWVPHFLDWLPTATAGLLDKLVSGICEAGRADAVQSFIDFGLRDPLRHPELLYWLWKGSKQTAALRVPADEDLFRFLLDTLSELGRTITAEPDVTKAFRHRLKAALALRDYAKVRQCLEKIGPEAAVTIKQQLQRLEGLGDNAPARMLDLLRDVHPHLWVVVPRQRPPWEDQDTVWCTAAGLARRIAERDEIVNVEMPKNAKRIGEAASHGDLSENSEYKFALEERDLLRARVAKINDELSRARTIEPLDVPTDHVSIGARVTLRSLRDRSERVMTFLGPFETNVEQHVYSYLAPFSQKLMGRRVGDRVTLTLDGIEQELEIVALTNALARQDS